MLTGDKLETATCIAKSSRLVSRTQDLQIFKTVTNRSDAHLELNAFRRKTDCALIVTGESLEVCCAMINNKDKAALFCMIIQPLCDYRSPGIKVCGVFQVLFVSTDTITYKVIFKDFLKLYMYIMS